MLTSMQWVRLVLAVVSLGCVVAGVAILGGAGWGLIAAGVSGLALVVDPTRSR